MIEFTLTLLSAFAVYRMSHLLKYDEGPFHVFQKLRVFLGTRASYSKIAKFFADIVNCCYCSSIWIAIPFALALCTIYSFTVINFIILWLGLAGVAEFIHVHSRTGD